MKYTVDFFTYGIPLVVTVLTLNSYIGIFMIPSRAEEYLRDTYPEYDLV